MSMRALVKEIAQVGLGALSLTLEKAEAVVEALVKGVRSGAKKKRKILWIV